MGLQVIGAGLPRTGATSLKQMLEKLLGDPCDHMSELYQRGCITSLALIVHTLGR